MTRSNSWHFYLNDNVNPSITFKGMHRLSIIMAGHPDVAQIIYALRQLHKCHANKRNFCFNDAKNEAMVQIHLP